MIGALRLLIGVRARNAAVVKPGHGRVELRLDINFSYLH